MPSITELQKKKLLGNRSSQLRTSTIVRTQTLDKAVLNGDHLQSNINYAAEHNSVRSALRRCRSSGYVPPMKVRTQPIPLPPQQPPTLLSIARGDHQVTITLAPPLDDGGSPITNYAYIIENASGGTYELFDPPQTSGPFVITGLLNGTPAYINFKAVNKVGFSESHSNTLVATPSTIPSTPTDLTAVSGNEYAEISFTQETDGGSNITDYLYQLNEGYAFVSSGGQVTSPVIIDGLVNGQTYQIALKAVNRNGQSASASERVSVTPVFTQQTITFLATPDGSAWKVPHGFRSIDYLVVGGGGGSGGGFDTGSGGGGGGGMVLSGQMTVAPDQTYIVIVGNGGSAGVSIRDPVYETAGGAGGNSQFGSHIALGGGGGGGSRSAGTDGLGGAAANVVTYTASLGGLGGGNRVVASTGGSGGGGGGNSSAGGNGRSGEGGEAGAGISNSISGSAVTYGKGGKGAVGDTDVNAVAGTPGSGNGADAGGATYNSDNNGAVGGSGIVIIRNRQT